MTTLPCLLPENNTEVSAPKDRLQLTLDALKAVLAAHQASRKVLPEFLVRDVESYARFRTVRFSCGSRTGSFSMTAALHAFCFSYAGSNLGVPCPAELTVARDVDSPYGALYERDPRWTMLSSALVGADCLDAFSARTRILEFPYVVIETSIPLWPELHKAVAQILWEAGRHDVTIILNGLD